MRTALTIRTPISIYILHPIALRPSYSCFYPATISFLRRPWWYLFVDVNNTSASCYGDRVQAHKISLVINIMHVQNIIIYTIQIHKNSKNNVRERQNVLWREKQYRHFYTKLKGRHVENGSMIQPDLFTNSKLLIYVTSAALDKSWDGSRIPMNLSSNYRMWTCDPPRSQVQVPEIGLRNPFLRSTSMADFETPEYVMQK